MAYKKGRYMVLFCIALLISGCSDRTGEPGATTGVTPPSAGVYTTADGETTTKTTAENTDAVSNNEPAMTDYLSYNLPEGLSEGGIPGSMGNSNLFVYDKAEIEDNPSVPLEVLAAGGVMFYERNLISFENGVISSVKSLWNHSEFLTAPERIPDCEANAVIVEAVFDLHTAAEIESAKAAGNPIPEDKQTVKMWYVFFAKEDGYRDYALFLNEKYFSKDDMIKLAQSAHFIDGAFNLYDPNLQYSQEYMAGTGNIKGDVRTKYFADISADFEIGANRYGYAVFKNPEAAFARLIKDYKAGIDLIQRECKLPPLSPDNYEAYMNLGWQVTTGTDEEKKQASFVSGFMDIYENSI